jgi:hypothetical protein
MGHKIGRNDPCLDGNGKKHKECNHRLRPAGLDMSRRIFKPTSRDIAGLSIANSVTRIQDAFQSYVAVKSS